jgi:hypothetical protein
MALEREMETYLRKLPELKDSPGKFALVHGDDLVGVFAAYEDALKAGYERFQLEPFLVKKIEVIETVHSITRLLVPCLASR